MTTRSPAVTVVAVIPGAVTVVAMAALVIAAPSLAERLVREDGPVEWAQVALALVALSLVAASARSGVRPGDVLWSALLVSLVWAEVDLDRRLLGTPIIDWRFLASASVPLAFRLLIPAALTAAGLGLIAYALRHRRALMAEVRQARREGWASLLVVGLLCFAIPQPCERCLERPFGLPRWVVEETLELVGTTYLALAAGRRWSARSIRFRTAARRGNLKAGP